ncbi:MAG: hypothetical protein M0Z36_09950 [Thermaerobacter sp.]|nr:hypothetical protein [Thermaerobacter sp.]
MPEEPVRIPDLDPRSDAHIIGTLALPGFLVLVAGVIVIAIGVLGLGHWLIGDIASLTLTMLCAGIWILWVLADGPRILMHRRQWRTRRTDAQTSPAALPAFPAAHAADPFWTTDGLTWAMARLTLPPVMLLDESTLASWHVRLAQAIRMAVTHGVFIDVRAAQLPGSEVVPLRQIHPVIAMRWRWWAQTLGPQSVQSVVLVRMAWPQTNRDVAAPHFLAIEQAWRAGAGPGDWQWLSAALARDLAHHAANPANAYAAWQKTMQERTTRQAAFTDQSTPTGPRRRATPPL